MRAHSYQVLRPQQQAADAFAATLRSGIGAHLRRVIPLVSNEHMPTDLAAVFWRLIDMKDKH